MVRNIIAKEDFLWYKKDQVIPEADYRDNWSIHVNIYEDKVVEPITNPLDINNDGKVDVVDANLAADIAKKVKAAVKKKK